MVLSQNQASKTLLDIRHLDTVADGNPVSLFKNKITQMISLTHFLLIVSAVSINSERWYSATVIETERPFIPIEINEYKDNPVDADKNLRSIDEISSNYGHSTEEINRWRFMKRTYSSNNQFKVSQQDSTVEYSRYKPKKIRKRCPEACSRKNERSNGTKTRFLELFQVVEFDNGPCMSSSGLEGTCLHEYECQSSGGTGMGSCADGYGSCCVTLMPCDSKSSAATGWFINPDYPMPSSDRLSCAVSLSKSSEDVTQIRLDFTTFEMLPPSSGVCQEDQFVVSGQNVNNVIPILCGINTGQHAYIEVSETDGPIYLSIQTANPANRLFSIKVTQLTSADDLTAPPGCLQHFTAPKGYVESFNYRDKSEIAIARISSYMNNLNYAMCIERVPGSCSVTYTNAGYLQIVNYDTEGLPVIPPGQAGVEIFNCPSDWLLISATRLCGDRLNDGSILQDFSLNAPITDSSAGPIVVWFRSDEGYVGRGFKLQYEQNACTSY